MLVVVAIIGILSSVILTALGPARNKARDARVIEEVNQARAIMESTAAGGVYGDLRIRPDTISSVDNTDLQSLATDIQAQGGGLYIEENIMPPFTWYIVFSALNTLVGPKADQVQYYCVDSGGHAVFTTTNPDGYQSCPAAS